jgi:hypothetical protein
MSRLRVESFCLSLDGYGAAPKQDLNNPFGEGGMMDLSDRDLHGDDWTRGRHDRNR